MTGRTIEDRVSFGEDLVSQTPDARENDDQTNLTDLLADLMHYAQAHELPFDQCVESARTHFEAEDAGADVPTMSYTAYARAFGQSAADARRRRLDAQDQPAPARDIAQDPRVGDHFISVHSYRWTSRDETTKKKTAGFETVRAECEITKIERDAITYRAVRILSITNAPPTGAREHKLSTGGCMRDSWTAMFTPDPEAVAPNHYERID